ncbi:MAG TPA: HAD-IIB family hydrolase, partial [Desulfobulbaceae bacterium]|nr:HAD-IIB family hydrolase [Desulfobulbaceae bacterium]
SILIDKELWNTLSNNGINGVRSNYSWQSHCEKVMQQFSKLLPSRTEAMKKEAPVQSSPKSPSFGKRLISLNRLMISDIDNTLIGDNKSMRELFALLESHRDTLAWGVSTGRSLELTIEAITEYNIPTPDIIICSVGTEIYYGPDLRMDKGWQNHISYQWRPEEIKEVLGDIDFLTFQESEGQRSHKISYYMADDYDYLFWVYYKLEEAGLQCRVIYSHGQFLDIVPVRASKGKAIDYLSYKYEFSPLHVMVAGDSGNDEDMLSGKARGLVVGNYSEELEKLKDRPNIYFSPRKYAAGIIDGLNHYGFI